MAAVGILLNASNEFGSDRIEMNVAHQLQKVFIPLTDNRLVTPLKEVADFAVGEVKVLGVGLLKPLHEFGERRSGALKEQMNVIRHEAVGVQADFVLLAVPPKTLQVGIVVPPSAEGFLAVVAAHDDVVEQAGGKQARATGHGEVFYQREGR